MLKKKILSIILAVALAVCPLLLAVPASAFGINYLDYIVDIKENANGECVVTMAYPVEYIRSYLRTNAGVVVDGSNTIEWPMRDSSEPQEVIFYSFQRFIDTEFIPPGAILVCNADTTFLNESVTPMASLSISEINTQFEQITWYSGQTVKAHLGGTTTTEVVFHKNVGCSALKFYVKFDGFGALEEQSEIPQRITITKCHLKMTVSSLLLQQAESGKQNEILKAVEQKLAENGKKLDDVINQQQQTNEKLDGIQDSLDNQIQNEIDKAESMGSSASDQVAAAIPDKSTELLPAMEKLAASLSYQGTEAKLPFPKVAMPAIPGVCASFELIPAQDIDFGSFIQMMPSTLITIIRALCDIAIVLWAFKEAYGIYQYVICLKGGGGGV